MVEKIWRAGWRQVAAHLGLNASMGAMLVMVICVGMWQRK